MTMRPRLTATLSTSVLLTALTALPASAAPATITANSGGGGDWTATTTPQLMYSDTQDVYSTSTSGQPVTFAASGGCTVKTIASVAGGLSHAKITRTSGTNPRPLTFAAAAGHCAHAPHVPLTLAPALTQNGSLILLAYRRPEIEATPGWKLLQTWERTGRAKILPLQPLTLSDLTQLLDDESPIPPDEIYAFTGGNPFLISEWFTEATPLPRPGESAITYRFRTLSLPAQTALQIAAVLGDIPYRIWADLTSLPPITLAALTDELTTHNWLQPAPTGYTFVHDLLRAAVYETLSPAQRRSQHARVAQAYQTHAPDNVRVLAFHLDQGGLEEEAAQAYRQAGEQNLARFAYREAQTDLARALALMPRPSTLPRVEPVLAFGQACETTGDRSAQHPVL